MTKIESERLVLYPLEDCELRQCAELETNEELKKAYHEMLQGCLEHPQQRIWYTLWNIELKNDAGTIVGDLGFKGLDENGMVEIGYGLREGFCKKGYMTEAVKTICQWALEQKGVTRIEAETTVDNRDSQRVLSLAGFVPTGECGNEGPRFVYLFCDAIRKAFEVLDYGPTGSGYDLKKKYLIDGEIRYL